MATSKSFECVPHSVHISALFVFKVMWAYPPEGSAAAALYQLLADPCCSYPPDETIRKSLIAAVRKQIGPIATPDTIHWAPGLPKTRSGKIMR